MYYVREVLFVVERLADTVRKVLFANRGVSTWWVGLGWPGIIDVPKSIRYVPTET